MDTPTSRRVFESVDPVAFAFDESRPYARKVIQLGGPASDKLWELETTLRGTTKQLSSRIATGIVNTIAQTVGLPSPETIANQIHELFTATAGFERSCIKIQTFGDDLRFLKDKRELHMQGRVTVTSICADSYVNVRPQTFTSELSWSMKFQKV